MTPTPTPGQQTAYDALDAALSNEERLFILWYGGIRAGKTMGATEVMARHSLTRSDCVYIIGGYSVRAVQGNVLPYFREWAKAHGVSFKAKMGNVNPHFTLGDNTFCIYGGGKSGDDRAVQGLTAAGLMLDEYELLERRFVKQCESRISVPGAIRVYTANKGSPYTWAVREYYDRVKSGSLKALLIESQTTENQHLELAFINEKVDEFDDYYRLTFLENEFGLPFNPLYEPTIETIADYAKPYLLGIYAYGNETARLLAYETPTGYTIEEVNSTARAPVSLVNATAPLLARGLSVGVKGYSPLFSESSVEICQLAFQQGKLKVSPAAKRLREKLTLYATPGVHPDCSILLLEKMGEYLQRINRWHYN